MLGHGVGKAPWERGAAIPIQVPLASLAHLHVGLSGLLRQHCSARDQRHLTLLGWMVDGLLSETVCFDRWKKAAAPVLIQSV